MEKLKARIAELEAENRRLKEDIRTCAAPMDCKYVQQAITGQKAVETMEKINLAVEFCPTDDHLIATITSLSNQYQEAVCRKAKVKEQRERSDPVQR